jgi:hypothetical protein
MGDEYSEQEGFSDIMSEEGEKKPTKKGDGKKKVNFTEDDENEEDALDEEDEYGDEEEGEEDMEEDG